MASGTYPSTIKRNGKTYEYYARAYGSVAIQDKSGKKLLGEQARRERQKGNLTIITEQKDKNDIIYRLYVCRTNKKRKTFYV